MTTVEPHAGAEGLGGEKGIGGAGECQIGKADAGVADGDGDLGVVMAGLDGEPAALGHGFHGVADQVDQHLAELVLIHPEGRVGFRQDQFLDNMLFLQGIIKHDQRFADQRIERMPLPDREILLDKAEQLLKGCLDPCCFTDDHVEKFEPLRLFGFPGQQTRRAADGGDRVADVVHQLRGHVAQGRETFRLDQEVLVLFQLIGHGFQLLDFLLHGHVQVAVLDGQAGLGGKTLQCLDQFIGNGLAGDKMVGDDHPQGAAGRVQGDNDKGVLIEEVEQFRRHRILAFSVRYQDGLPAAGGPDQDVFAVLGTDLKGTGDDIDLGIRVQAAFLDVVDEDVDPQVLLLHLPPDAAGLVPAAGTDGDLALQGVAAFVEQGQEGPVEAKPLVRGDADENRLQDFVELHHGQVGGVHFHGQFVQEVDPEVGLFDLALIEAVVDGQASFFQDLAHRGDRTR